MKRRRHVEISGRVTKFFGGEHFYIYSCRSPAQTDYLRLSILKWTFSTFSVILPNAIKWMNSIWMVRWFVSKEWFVSWNPGASETAAHWLLVIVSSVSWGPRCFLGEKHIHLKFLLAHLAHFKGKHHLQVAPKFRDDEEAPKFRDDDDHPLIQCRSIVLYTAVGHLARTSYGHGTSCNSLGDLFLTSQAWKDFRGMVLWFIISNVWEAFKMPMILVKL